MPNHSPLPGTLHELRHALSVPGHGLVPAGTVFRLQGVDQHSQLFRLIGVNSHCLRLEVSRWVLTRHLFQRRNSLARLRAAVLENTFGDEDV
jgi:hypothetical protein